MKRISLLVLVLSIFAYATVQAETSIPAAAEKAAAKPAAEAAVEKAPAAVPVAAPVAAPAAAEEVVPSVAEAPKINCSKEGKVLEVKTEKDCTDQGGTIGK